MEQHPQEKVQIAVESILERRGQDVVVMDMRDVTTICDYFVICHGLSPTHIDALAEEVQQQMKADGHLPFHIEGSKDGRWVIQDYLEVVVHIFTQEARRFYDLQRLWSDAKIVAEYSEE
ncbi:MAG: ribosome silencing factor [Armatimonadota bacterium]